MAAPGLTIGIDARAATHPQPGGFKTYVRNLIWGLSAVDGQNTYRLYVDRPSGEALAPADERFRVEVVRSRMPVVGPVWREQALLPARALAHRVDVVHLPSGTAPVWHPAPSVVTIHDAIEQMPRQGSGAAPPTGGTRRRLMRLYNRYCQRLAVRRAAVVLTVSECSRRDLISYLGIPAEKVRVVPEAPGPQFRPLALPVALGGISAEDDPFILAIGSADPRKNLATLIRAFAALPTDMAARYRLLLVWSHGLLQHQLLRLAREEGVADRITSVTAPTDEELCRLYNAATVFVFPSLYEGFGLPPLEAMACGTPVIASNTSSLLEVLGDGALLVDPTPPALLTEALGAVLSDADLRRELSTRGQARARGFSWERTAAQTLSVYQEVAAARGGCVIRDP